jgi:hypothetical protein
MFPQDCYTLTSKVAPRSPLTASSGNTTSNSGGGWRGMIVQQQERAEPHDICQPHMHQHW